MDNSELRTKVEEVEAKNDKFYIENKTLRIDAEKKKGELNNANENISRLNSKLETETRRSVDAHASYTDELKKKTTALKSKVRLLKEEKVELNTEIRELQEERSKLKNSLEKVKSEKSSGITPSVIKKFKQLKSKYISLKTENKSLKQQIQKKDAELHNQRVFDELFQSSSDDDSDNMEIDVVPTSSRNVTAESVTSPPPAILSKTNSSFGASSAASGSSRHGVSVPTAQKILFADQIPAPMHQRTSSPSSSKNSTPSVNKSGLKQKAASRTSGLEVPPPKITAPVTTTTAKPKKAINRLRKFVNSRCPSKVIDSRPLIYRSPSSAVRGESSVAGATDDASPVEERKIKKIKLNKT